MNVIQPYLIKSNLLVPAIRKNIILNDNSNLKRQAPKMDSNRSLPSTLLFISQNY